MIDSGYILPTLSYKTLLSSFNEDDSRDSIGEKRGMCYVSELARRNREIHLFPLLDTQGNVTRDFSNVHLR
jgi:hypothetical protein